MKGNSHPMPPREFESLDADLFDYAKLRDYVGFVKRSAVRHKRVVVVVFLVTVAVAAAALRVLPKKYHSEIKLQAQRNQTISALAGLDRAVDIEAPTRNAADLVLRTDNLVSLVRKTKLVDTWEAHRAPLQKLKDKLMGLVRKPLSPEAMQDMLVATLEQQISVTIGEDSVVIGVDWWDPGTAYRLVMAAYENFLEARQFRETAAISEALGLLESRAQEQREQLEAGVQRVLELHVPVKTKAGAVAVAPKRVEVAQRVNPELQRVRDSLRAKEQAIADVQEARLRHISELEAKLSEMKQVYSEFHPAVIDLVETIQREEQSESPQLASLRDELRQLQTQYERLGGTTLDGALDAAKPKALPSEALRLIQTEQIESPEIESAKSELRYQMAHYAALIERIDQVRMERETQQAAFRYRYSILRPAMMPNAPSKPTAGSILLGAAIAGILLGISAAVITDLRSRVIYERWQVDRLLELEVLAEIKLL